MKNKNYYRLKLVYADNSYQYSNTISLLEKNVLKAVIFPNPVINSLNIQTVNASYNKLRILDVTGRIEISQNINAVNTSVDVSNLNPGTHLIKFTTDAGEEQVQKFVKIK